MKIYRVLPFTSVKILYRIGIPVQTLNLFHVTSLLFLFKILKIKLTPVTKSSDTTLFIPVARQLIELSLEL